MGFWAEFKEQLKSEVAKDAKLQEGLGELQEAAGRQQERQEEAAKAAAEKASQVKEQTAEAAGVFQQRVAMPVRRAVRRGGRRLGHGAASVAHRLSVLLYPAAWAVGKARPVVLRAVELSREAERSAEAVYRSDTPVGRALRRVQAEREHAAEVMAAGQSGKRHLEEREYEATLKEIQTELDEEMTFRHLWDGKVEEAMAIGALSPHVMRHEAQDMLEMGEEKYTEFAERIIEAVNEKEEAELAEMRAIQEKHMKEALKEEEFDLEEAMRRDAAEMAREEEEERMRAREEAAEDGEEVERDEDEEAGEDEEEEEAAPAGPSAIERVEKKQTVWERRLEQMREAAEESAAFRGAKKAQLRVMRTETMENVQDKLDDISERLEHSQDPFLWKTRELMDKVTSETEHGVALAQLRKVDPTFREDLFLRDMETAFIPQVVKAFLRGDMTVLNRTMTANASRVVRASMKERDAIGVRYDDRILDISNLDVSGIVIHPEEDTPVVNLTFWTQQIHCLRSMEDNSIVEGSEADIQQVVYSVALQRSYDQELGWICVEFSYQRVFALAV